MHSRNDRDLSRACTVKEYCRLLLLLSYKDESKLAESFTGNGGGTGSKKLLINAVPVYFLLPK